MRCFTVTDRPVSGLYYDMNPVPALAACRGFDVQLDPEFATEIEVLTHLAWDEGKLEWPSKWALKWATLNQLKGRVVLQKQSPDLRRKNLQALVRLDTAAGIGGTVRLTSCLREEVMVQGRVVLKDQVFPPLGVAPLCDEATVRALREGVPDGLNVYVMMNPGSAVRIHLSGRLEDHPATLQVKWTGEDLLVMHPQQYAARQKTPRMQSAAA
jgi:hypothetical protein